MVTKLNKSALNVLFLCILFSTGMTKNTVGINTLHFNSFFSGEKIRTSLTLRSSQSSQTKIGDVVNVYGQLAPELALSPGLQSISIWVEQPDGSFWLSDQPSEIDPKVNSVEVDIQQEYWLAIPVTQYGNMHVKARFGGDSNYEPSESEIIISVLPPTGMAIIVTGGGLENELMPLFENNSDYVLSVLQRRLFSDDQTNETFNKIWYMHPDNNHRSLYNNDENIVDAVPTLENLEWAITNWAVSHVQVTDEHGNWDPESVMNTPLTLYLVGDTRFYDDRPDEIYMGASESLAPSLLDDWLDEFENIIIQKFIDAGATPPSYMPINLIVDCPSSGSYIEPIKKFGRIILTSSDVNEPSHILSDGSVSFSGFFFSCISAGYHIFPAFAGARSYQQFNPIMSTQTFQLEATGIGNANEVADEAVAYHQLLAYRNSDELRPNIEGGWVHKMEGNADFEVVAYVHAMPPTGDLKSVEAVIIPPPGSYEGSRIVHLSRSINSPKRWEGSYGGFYGSGKYEVVFTASDLLEGNDAYPFTTQVNIEDTEKPENVTAVRVIDPTSEHIGLQWIPSPSHDVQGYKIYANPPEIQDTTNSFLIGDVGNVHQYDMTEIDVFEQLGLWEFKITAYDRAGLESSGYKLQLKIGTEGLGVFIPDPNFEQALIDLGHDSDETINQQILLSDAYEITFLGVSRPLYNPDLPNFDGKIHDLTGIEAFVNLNGINCSENEIVTLNLSNATKLKYLKCSYNQLSRLDISQNIDLETLECYYNQLISLDISNNQNIRLLRCYNNQIANLDLSKNLALEQVDCLVNQLSSLDVTKNSALRKLDCSANMISSLDLSQNTSLLELNCGANQLNTLDVTNNPQLVDLICYRNNLKHIDLRHNLLLGAFYCPWNKIQTLDLTKNTKLTKVLCSYNQLSELDFRNENNHAVDIFDASNNFLSCINIDDETADHSNWLIDEGAIFSNNCDHNTQPGDGVSVIPLDRLTLLTPADILFEQVVRSGNTKLEISGTGPEIPEGCKTGEPYEVYNIETNAEYLGQVKICIDYHNVAFQDETSVRLLHYESDHWEDITTTVDYENDRIIGNTISLSPFVVVEDNQPPDITYASDIFVECDPGQCDALVSYSVVAIDNCDNDVELKFSPEPGSKFQVGTTIVSCIATDDAGNTSSQFFNVTVRENVDPIIDVIATPLILWPPNHDYKEYNVSDFILSVWDNCQSLSISSVNIIKATSDESEVGKGGGDGKTFQDIVISEDCKSIKLRREREASSNGRVYRVYFEVDDGNGNSATASASIHVPKQINNIVKEDEPAYEVVAKCGNKAFSFNGIDDSVIPNILSNYPNPFSSSTTIVFSVDRTAHTELKLLNCIGQEIAVLFDEEAKANQEYHLIFSGEGLPEGLYFCLLQSRDLRLAIKILLSR